MSDDQIKHMVSRFLQWKLPENFAPDGGITFTRNYNVNTPHPMKHEPVGTNLLDYTQAEAMVRHMIEGLPMTASEARATAAEAMLAEAVKVAFEHGADTWVMAKHFKHYKRLRRARSARFRWAKAQYGRAKAQYDRDFPDTLAPKDKSK